MPLTLTLNRGAASVHGNMRRNVLDVAFDTSYPDGGEPLTARQLGLASVQDVHVQPQLGYHFNYDRTNSTLRAFRASPVVVVEDTGAFTAGAAYTLKNIPGYILSIRGTTGSTGAKRVIPTGETAGAGQVAVTWTTGVLTWGDAAITRAIIQYIPRGVPGFTTDRLVVDELVTLADVDGTYGSGTLANRAAAICYVWNDEDNEVLTYVPVAENPGANQVDIDINSSGDTVLRVLTSDIANGAARLKVTYLTYAAAIHERLLRFVDQADRTVTSNVAGPGTDQTLNINGLVIPGFGQQIVGEDGGGGNEFSTMVDADGAAAATVAVWNPWRGTFTFDAGDAYVTMEIPLIYIPQELAGNVLLEVPDATDLSFLSAVRLIAEGF